MNAPAHFDALPRFATALKAIESLKPSEPLYLVHPDKFASAARQFLDGYPGDVLYAVKANPAPQVLERLVRSRVDRLSPAAQEAIRAGAVLGPEFNASLLAAVLGTSPAELAPALEELVDSDLVHREPPESRAVTFRFRHALIQEATYLGLLRAERRRLHAAAAAALEAASRDRLP